MLDTSATYYLGEPKKRRRWWALFIAGILTLGLLSLAAMVAVRSDKKFLKQMALALFYLNLPFVLIGLALDASSIQDAAASVWQFGGLGVALGFGIAAYAQHKIDIM